MNRIYSSSHRGLVCFQTKPLAASSPRAGMSPKSTVRPFCERIPRTPARSRRIVSASEISALKTWRTLIMAGGVYRGQVMDHAVRRPARHETEIDIHALGSPNAIEPLPNFSHLQTSLIIMPVNYRRDCQPLAAQGSLPELFSRSRRSCLPLRQPRPDFFDDRMVFSHQQGTGGSLRKSRRAR